MNSEHHACKNPVWPLGAAFQSILAAAKCLFGASARSATTTLQRRGGLQGGSPPCTDFFLILGKIGTFSEAFFSKSWIKIKQKFSGHL